jgi:hypothetical protein
MLLTAMVPRWVAPGIGPRTSEYASTRRRSSLRSIRSIKASPVASSNMRFAPSIRANSTIGFHRTTERGSRIAVHNSAAGRVGLSRRIPSLPPRGARRSDSIGRRRGVRELPSRPRLLVGLSRIPSLPPRGASVVRRQRGSTEHSHLVPSRRYNVAGYFDLRDRPRVS